MNSVVNKTIKRRFMKTIAFCLLLVLSMNVMMAQVATHPKSGPAGSWRVLGTTHANHTADHDAIYVQGPYDFLRKLKFKVTDAPLNIQRMIVRYDDGGAPENINTRYEIAKGGESRVIELKGGKRKLKAIEFRYETKGLLNGKADVTLFGMK